jgi:hypothetical protein
MSQMGEPSRVTVITFVADLDRVVGDAKEDQLIVLEFFTRW